MTRALCFAALILGVLAGCASPPVREPGPEPSTPAVLPSADTALLRGRARWVPARWADLPGWDADRTAELWPALLRGCERPAAGWDAVCAEARRGAPGDDAAVRTWLQARLQPYRVESLDGAAAGLITGYFEPLVEASRALRGKFRVPLLTPPADLPHASRTGRASSSTRCRPRRPVCVAARLPGWPIRSMP